MGAEQVMQLKERAQAFLLATQHPDGGWGYATGGAAAVEPTATVLLALRDEPSTSQPRERAIAWLRAAQHRDGGWGLSADDPESAWQTAWGILALERAGRDKAAPERGRRWLLEVEPFLGADEMNAEWRRLLSIDPRLRGWPWRPGEASWVEPTALALLALAGGTATDGATPRIAEAVRYLADRRCAGGGWNFGNPVMLGAALPPRAGPTALALLALARHAADAIQPADIAVLRREMAREGGALALAWGLLALRALDPDDSPAAAALASLQREDGSWNANPYHTALAALALSGEGIL